jgi:hypothetical protein
VSVRLVRVGWILFDSIELVNMICVCLIIDIVVCVVFVGT